MERGGGAFVFIIIANVNEMDLDQVVCALGQGTNNLPATISNCLCLAFSPLTHPASPLTILTCPCSQPNFCIPKTGASHRRATI